MWLRRMWEKFPSSRRARGVGEVAGNALEMSNVDLARQFVDLITTQRTFQANSVTIKTADEVYQTTLQMMR